MAQHVVASIRACDTCTCCTTWAKVKHLLPQTPNANQPDTSYTQRLISMQTVTRAPISRQNSGKQPSQSDAERRRGFAMHDDLDFTYRISDRDAALPMLIDMGHHK